MPYTNSHQPDAEPTTILADVTAYIAAKTATIIAAFDEDRIAPVLSADVFVEWISASDPVADGRAAPLDRADVRDWVVPSEGEASAYRSACLGYTRAMDLVIDNMRYVATLMPKSTAR